MVWLFPSSAAAADFVSRVAAAVIPEEGAVSGSPPLLEALPITGAQLPAGQPCGLDPWSNGDLPPASAAVLAAGVHGGNSAGLPGAAVASMPPQLAVACGAQAWHAPGVALLCSVGCAVHKLWSGGVKLSSEADAATALEPLRQHMLTVLLPEVLKRGGVAEQQ